MERSTSAPSPAGAPALPRLRHEPALDGLRGVAVAVVVLFHLGRLQGGFLGVDLFFVLSGFLITSLLVVEDADRGAIGLRAFWARRARRLLPALFMVVAGVAVLIATLTPAGDRPTFRGDALATLGYVANWHALADEAGYWDLFVQPSPLDHMWSLAIEEQFYVLWPPLVVAALALARRRRRGDVAVLAGLSSAAALVSFVVLALAYSPLDTNRAYYGTDARVGPTLLGATLAVLTAGSMHSASPGAAAPGSRAGWREGALGWAAVAVIGWTFISLDGIGPTYYRGGLVAFSVAAVTLVFVVTSRHGSALGRALSSRPLTALGAISYGVYLWHWPVIVYLTAERTPFDGAPLDLLRVLVTLGLAVVSYHLVERPIRRGALRGRPVRGALVGSVAVTAGVVLVATAGTARVPGTDVAMGAMDGDGGYTLRPEDIPAGAERILLVGDSGPTYLGPALAAEAERVGAVATTAARPWCTILQPEGASRAPDGAVTAREPCHEQRREAWSALVEEFDPDVVVYYLAAGGGATEMMLDGDWVTECDRGYGSYLAAALGDDVDVLAAGGAVVALATTPEAPFVMGGQPVLDALDCRRATFDDVAGRHPRTEVVDLAAVLRDATDEQEASLYRDAAHLSEAGAAVAARWLVPRSLALLDDFA
ncbi:MAG: acyltransferase [Acidimicrobiales bacterium]|nr:acyltransferase [Acidimicrobiales bacterium]